jgi:hypothetical protein
MMNTPCGRMKTAAAKEKNAVSMLYGLAAQKQNAIL